MVFSRKKDASIFNRWKSKNVTGEVKVRLFKGNCILLGRRSSKSIYDQGIVSFDEGGGYDQSDASGFIKLNALRLKLNRNK